MSPNVSEANVLPLFKDAFRKLEWSKYQIIRLSNYLRAYELNGIQSHFGEDDKGGDTWLFSVSAAHLAEPTALVVGDIIRNIRSPLDYAVSAMFRDRGLPDNNAYFPTAGVKKNLAARIANDLEKKGFPKLTPFFLDEINATEEAKSPIWQLNQIDRVCKHRTLIIIEELVVQMMPSVAADDGPEFVGNRLLLRPGQPGSFRIPKPGLVIDDARDQRSFTVKFGPKEFFAGEDVIPKLVGLHQATLEVLQKLNTAYRDHYL